MKFNPVLKTSLATLVLTTSSCAIFGWNIEQQLRAAHGCIGVGRISEKVATPNRSLALITAGNRAKADYLAKCTAGDNKNVKLNISYDPNTNTAYAIPVTKDN